MNALAFKLPSVTHLMLVVENYKPNLSVAEFLSRTFPNLEVLQFDILADEGLIGLANTNNCLTLKSCHAAQIPSEFLFSMSAVLKNLA